MSLQLYIDSLDNEITKLLKDIDSKNKEKLEYTLLSVKFNKKLLELKDEIQVIDNVKNSKGFYKPYQINELVIITEFRNDYHKKVCNDLNIHVGDIINVTERTFNDRIIFKINGHEIDNHNEIKIKRLYSDKIFILNK